MTQFIQILLLPIIFIAVKYAAHWLIENRHIPSWLNYKPFNCELCLTFWLLIGVYLSFLIFNWWILPIAGVILAILNAIAMIVDQRNKTVKI